LTWTLKFRQEGAPPNGPGARSPVGASRRNREASRPYLQFGDLRRRPAVDGDQHSGPVTSGQVIAHGADLVGVDAFALLKLPIANHDPPALDLTVAPWPRTFSNRVLTVSTSSPAPPNTSACQATS
jgi:hypothetical protein